MIFATYCRVSRRMIFSSLRHLRVLVYKTKKNIYDSIGFLQYLTTIPSSLDTRIGIRNTNEASLHPEWVRRITRCVLPSLCIGTTNSVTFQKKSFFQIDWKHLCAHLVWRLKGPCCRRLPWHNLHWRIHFGAIFRQTESSFISFTTGEALFSHHSSKIASVYARS